MDKISLYIYLLLDNQVRERERERERTGSCQKKELRDWLGSGWVWIGITYLLL